jgi:putative drug exporter of the RND superfamily
MAEKRNMARTLGGWSASHRKAAVLGWLLFVLIVTLLGNAWGQVGLPAYRQLAGGSAEAEKILEQAHISDPAVEWVLIRSARPAVTSSSPVFRRAVATVLDGISSTRLVSGVESPYADRLVSNGGRDALVRFNMRTGHEGQVSVVLAAVAHAQAASPGFSMRETGAASAQQALNNTIGANFARAEWTAVPVALGILLVGFGALVAASLPLILALSAFAGALGLADLLSHVMPLSSYANSVMLLIGLAVGVDYSLFYLRRERQERAAGRSHHDALAVAAATSGRSVLISGLVVMTGMAGMLISGMATFVGFGLAAILVVLVSMLASVTVLPATLSWLGDRVGRGRVPLLARPDQRAQGGKGTTAGGGKFSRWLVSQVLARPRLSAVLAGVMLLVLAAPALGMHTESLGLEQLLPYDSPQAVAARQVAADFPGAPSPVEVVIKARDAGAPNVQRAIASFERAALRTGDVRQPVQVQLYPAVGVAELQAPLPGDGSGPVSQRALISLRDKQVPSAFGRIPGVEAYVDGDLAQSLDYNRALHQAALRAFAFVLVSAFLLMLFALRSLVIAAVTVLLDAVSVAVAYGVMTAVFQHGWGASLVATHPVGAIESWIPLFLFAVLFGLSMDYHVFVTSRIREAHDRGLSTRAAVSEGVQASASVVTSAALIMVAVFAVFATLSMQDFKQLGVGLGAAVLIDATLVRLALLPSLIVLLDERSWYLPRWLSWVRPASIEQEPAYVLDEMARVQGRRIPAQVGN